jgi:adenine-specific DNA-methyltransferase
MATRKKVQADVVTASAPAQDAGDAIQAVKHRARRKNIPPAGIEAQGRVEEAPKLRHHYNPHLSPVLRSSPQPADTDRLPELLQTARQRALSDDEAQLLAAALRRHEPWLEWSGKRERPWFEVDPVALHIHERVSTQAMLRVLAREDVNRDLFADPQQSYAEAVQFYRHDVDWSNRMILGDSLAVMASLSRREDLAGKVQMVYIDPPYGISFKSNFQPQLGQRDVKDKAQDLTREPEMVKAYRDTWTLGVHSYLAYLRDRLAMARELLTDSGSVFVQISDENLHRVRCLMDEVYGTKNFIALIAVKKTTGATADFIPGSCDYLLWFAKNKEQARFRPLFDFKRPGEEGATGYSKIEFASGARQAYTDGDDLPAGAEIFAGDNITSQSLGRDKGEGAASWFKVAVDGFDFDPGPKARWKTNEEGMTRLLCAERLMGGDRTTLSYKRKLSDFPVTPLTNIWSDTVGQNQLGGEKIYIVQTALKIVERCILMTTDPGDLVLDPTCGSGTTAFVAEKWGRRWITCDTSRVALALAKQRLMTASFEHFKLRPLNAEDLARNPRGAWLRNGTAEPRTFRCKTVPHITLRSIARNTALDAIFARHEPVLSERLAALNAALAPVAKAYRQELAGRLVRKHREEGAHAVTEADCRRWLLPDTHQAAITEAKAAKPLKALTAKQATAYRAAIPKTGWLPWQVPFDADADWPPVLAQALTAYRAAWRAKMDEVNACIAANAELEELVDQPETVPGVVRVAGPFSIEGVIALEQGLHDDADSPIAGAPAALDTFGADADEASTGAISSSNAEAHLDKVLRLLKAAGVDFARNKHQRFARLEPISSPGLLHAEGAWVDADERRVAVSIGPEVGNVSAFQVEDAVRSANRAGYDELVFAGFGFDAQAQAVIDEASHPRLRLHMALIRPDVAMGELLKTQPGSQLFMVFSAPRIKPPRRLADGQNVLEVEGMDVYDPVSNALYPTSRDRIAAWLVDTDYDGRSFCICQAFFPDRKKWDKLARALGDKGVVDESRFDALTGWESLPFARPPALPAGRAWRVAVKVIDPRGTEGLRVLTLEGL